MLKLTFFQELLHKNKTAAAVSHARFLCFFRQVFFSVILLEVCQLMLTMPMWLLDYRKSPLMFCPQLLTCFCWASALIMLIHGRFYRFGAVVNYLCCVCVLGYFHLFEYHVDHIYTVVSLFALFLPLSTSDLNILQTRQDGHAQHISLILMTLGVGLVYLDSIFYKLPARMWMSGLGYWLPATMPDAVWLNHGWLLNARFLIEIMGRLPLIVEGLFIFLLWFPRLRKWCILGAALHLGILLTYPIPLFALAELSFYLLLIPFLLSSHQNKTALETTSRPISVPQITFLKILFMAAIMLQSIITLNSPYLKHRIQYIPALQTVRLFVERHMNVVTRFTGLTEHKVFVDEHFMPPFDRVRAIAQQHNSHERFLPGADETGMGSLKMSGRFWTHRKFALMPNDIASAEFKERVRGYLDVFGTRQKTGVEIYHVYEKHMPFQPEHTIRQLEHRRAVPYTRISTIEYRPDDPSTPVIHML